MGEELLRSRRGSDSLHSQPSDLYSENQASPTPALCPNKRRHHSQPSKTLQIPSSETLWPESPRAVHQSFRVHDHHPEFLRHDRRDRPSESLTPPPGLAASHRERFQHHLRVHPHEKARDPEKVEGENWHEETHAYRGPFSAHHTTIHYSTDEDCEDGNEPEDHSVWILIYLSSLSPFLAVLFALYAVLTTAIILLLLPFSFFCTERKPLRSQLHFFLTPPIGFQLGLIYSDIRVSTTVGDDVSMLILVNMCSPFYAIWISASAWVAAFFWAFTAIMGDPDGKDGKDDGREAVMGVRRWWERWLERALQ